MRNRHGAVGVRDVDTGKVTSCARGGTAGYDTLCGNSLSDDCLEEIEISDTARINCEQCKDVWAAAHRFKAKDFT
jgi:hypothetical protein